jgi:hypothetical protein
MAATAAKGGGEMKAHVSWNVETTTGHTEGIVIAKLPGMTDEKVVMIAHTDGLFEGATDDGAGVAALIETANYFVEQPKEKRRRTMYFIALPDHHSGDSGGRWMHENFKTMFPNTAVLMNAEHIAAKAPVYDREWRQHVAPSLFTNRRASLRKCNSMRRRFICTIRAYIITPTQIRRTSSRPRACVMRCRPSARSLPILTKSI